MHLQLKVIKRSQAAVNEGKFKDEIAAVEIPQKKGEPLIMSKDEEPFNVKFDKIAELKSPFEKDGTVTAANASTINDGAAAVVLMSKEKADAAGRKARCKNNWLCRCRAGAGMVYNNAFISCAKSY